MTWNIRLSGGCRHDLISRGKSDRGLERGEGRVRNARQFKAAIVALVAFIATTGTTATGPVFLPGQDPKPAGKSWRPVTALSDEFDGERLDPKKWQTSPVENGWGWRGRPPGLFTQTNVTVLNGRLRVTAGKLDEPVKVGKNRFTHYGAVIRSLKPGNVGLYYETRMKANRTVMSSTFWLMTKDRQGGRRQEVDIQECVGRTTDKAAGWSRKWNRIFHSNAIDWGTREKPTRIQLQKQSPLPTHCWERFYTYGAWWKSPKEIRFYLDGKYAYSIHPQADWNQDSFIHMVVETYDWNPLPDDGGLLESGTWEDRTTQYDWVRVWRLE